MTALYLGVGLIALAVLVIALVLALGIGSREPTGVAKSLALIDGSVGSQYVGRNELPTKDRFVTPFIDACRRLAVRLSPSGTVDRLTRSLDRAGNPALWTVDRIMGVKGLALLLGVALGFLYVGLSLAGLLLAVVLGAVGLFVPDLLLYNAALRRQEKTSKGLADTLDILTVCVEAGQGFDSALLRVAREGEGPMADEFARVLSEMQLGTSRADAFSALGERVSLPEVKNFVSAIVQADRLGIPIAKVLREQTSAMRVTRRQKGEEKAQKVTVKILFPLLFCIFPALFVVIIGPGMIRIMTNLFGAGGLGG
ncbi:secretion system protein TadC [Janibacter sp. Soil728]|uniref:type II secretion system F family protein n=1 Tax=Janibacter sp. Soil728 TaxID=1736393 RepID=UPI0006FDA652|nr:type II secretion system F family protein [Janibacter sp. Soil728]KRE39441.1 secretion system protein TadC [Janibacter sp. Soil728]